MMECGTTCLAMIFKYYGYYNIQPVLAELGEISTEGPLVRLLRILALRLIVRYSIH